MLDLAFQKKGDSAKHYPLVSVCLVDYLGAISDPFDACIDTGAHITTVPFDITKKVMMMPMRKALVRAFDGKVQSKWVYRCKVVIEGLGAVFNPPDGLLVTQSKMGLIGLDLLKHMRFVVEGKKFTLDLIDGGDVGVH